MFEMSAYSDVEVTTFELDIRLDMNPLDLSVEVYTIDGSYDLFFDKPDAWQQLAATALVLAPEGNSAVIPVADFTSINIPARGKRSFYITMKGPYLDPTVFALQKTGDVHIKGDDLQLLVGSGFTSYKFPDAIDTVLHPQFAGIVHYKKKIDCHDTSASTTAVDFQFIFEMTELDAPLISITNAAIERAVDELLVSNASLRRLVEEYGLSKSSAAETSLVIYPGK
jgi:hypothetical protein